jgi:hypothetical protein
MFKKDVKHQAYQLKQFLHSDHKKRDSSFMATTRGIPAALLHLVPLVLALW